MTSPLIERLSSELHYPVLSLETLDAFVHEHEYSVLFFTEDYKRFPESNDVAVVLPELVTAFDGSFAPAIISCRDEKKLHNMYGFTSWPALVFLRRGEYLGAITGIKDWIDYLTEIKKLLAAESTRPPSIGIPVVSN